MGTGFASIGLRRVFCKNLEKQLFVLKMASESVHLCTRGNCSEKILEKFEKKLGEH